ncbi:MAG: DUF5689 domain-containing protein [Rikenellaceae bacterium]
MVACSSIESGVELVSIASLRNIETNSRSVLISENIAIEGIITANDKYGEFYNCLIIEDGSAAVKIMCDYEDLYISYPIHNTVTIYCSGLYLINHYGAITLGAEPTGDYTLDYISQANLGRYVKSNYTSAEPFTPPKLDICELTPLHYFQMVELDEVTISGYNGSQLFCVRDSTTNRTVDTYHTITDKNGDTAELSVDRLCMYADDSLPTITCNIQAIVGYYDQQYSLTITDCKYWY